MNKISKFFINIKEELEYKFEIFSNKLRELKFRILGISRLFYCQRECEYKSKCKYQCDHCEIYYRPLEKERGWK